MAKPVLGFEVVSCAMSGEVEPVKQAILTKYHINSKDASSQATVLHAVASALALDQNIKDGHIELVRWLLENGIDYSIRDGSGKTAEDRLVDAKQHHEAAKALDIVKKWRERNTLTDQEARRHNLHRDAKKEKHDIGEADRLLKTVRTVKVTVVSATGLPPMDRNGLADPYCKLRYGAAKQKEKKLMASMGTKPAAAAASEKKGSEESLHKDSYKDHKHHLFPRQKFHTKWLPKTLTPTWNELFTFETNRLKDSAKYGPPPHENEDYLRVEVWDKDTAKDDFMGYVQISLAEIVDIVARGEKEHRFVLSPDKAGNIALRFEVA